MIRVDMFRNAITDMTARTLGITALLALAASGLTGCAAGERTGDRLASNYDGDRAAPWVWTQPDRYGFQPDPQRESLRGSGSHDASIAVFSGVPTPVADATLTRRDDLMGVRETGVLPDRLGWPTAPQADLRQQRTYRSSTTADRWVYPSTRRDADHHSRSHYGRRGY